jgi:hypothetical protein
MEKTIAWANGMPYIEDVTSLDRAGARLCPAVLASPVAICFVLKHDREKRSPIFAKGRAG